MPLFVDLSGRRCLVVGAGEVGTRRAELLAAHGARVCVVGPDATSRLRELVAAGVVGEWRQRAYRTGDAEGCALVVAATDRREVNRVVAADAARAGALVNVADAPEEGDVVVPSVVRRGELAIAVTTGGASPTLARRVRQDLERSYGPEWGPLTALLGELRPRLVAHRPAAGERRAAVDRLLASAVSDLLAAGDRAAAERLARRILLDEDPGPVAPAPAPMVEA
jgi:precorrin-2 dehydrogenase/sirohydrochlorin ferrochelatase